MHDLIEQFSSYSKKQDEFDVPDFYQFKPNNLSAKM